MFALIGIVVVLAAVLGGFVLEGGPIPVLIQIAEFVIIGGACIGTLLISAPGGLLKKVATKMLGVFRGSTTSKQTYINLLKLMYDLFQLGQKEGLVALEQHIENPDQSAIFKNYPDLLKRHHLLSFLNDTIRILMDSGANPHDIEALMDADIETHHQEGAKPAMLLQKIGDSLPGLGIVAAVLGIVITMQAIDGPAAEIGHKVAAALVGTFIGILLCYGFFSPMATNMELATQEESRVLEVVKAGVSAYAKGLRPIVAVEFARRTIFSDYRPHFAEMEQALRGAR